MIKIKKPMLLFLQDFKLCLNEDKKNQKISILSILTSSYLYQSILNYAILKVGYSMAKKVKKIILSICFYNCHPPFNARNMEMNNKKFQFCCYFG